MKATAISKSLAVVMSAAVFLSACGTKSAGGGSTAASDTGTKPADTKTADTAPPKKADPVTVEFWHAYGEGEDKVLQEKVIPKFEQDHPNIKIKATRMPTENLDQQVLTAAAGGTPPDVMRMDLTWVPNMAKQGVLQTVESFPGFKDIMNASFKGPMDSNLYNGKYYGVPLDTNTKVAIYNLELLQKAGASEPPKTMDDLAKLARSIKASGKYSGITIGGVDVWNISPWFWTLGGTYTDQNYTKATGYLNSDASVKALDTIVGWYKEGLLAPPILGGQPGTWEGLRGDKGAAPQYMMINDGPWFYSIIGDKDTKGKMIPAIMPTGPDGKSHSVVGGEDMVVFKGAKHPKEAWEFVQYMTSVDTQVLIAKETGQMPTIMKAADAPELKDVWYLQTYVDQLKTAYTRTPSPNANKINDAIQAAFESVIRGKAATKDALDKAAQQVDTLLSEK